MKILTEMIFQTSFLVLIFLSQLKQIQPASRNIRNKFRISVHYDDTFDHVEDLVAYTIEANNHVSKKSSYQFQYNITKIQMNDAYKLKQNLCRELNEGLIAVLAIGDSKVFEIAKVVANSLEIPFITIKTESNAVSTALMPDTKYELNIHPPINKIMEAMIDLVNHYKWTFFIILFQEPSRIEDFIRLPTSKHRLIFKYLSNDTSEWSYVLKEIKSSGSFHLIIDIETRLINTFLDIADENGITSFYYHLVFTSLDLSVITNMSVLKLSANITAFQVFEPNNLKINALFAGLNLNRNFITQRKIDFKYVPSIAIFIYDAFLLLSNTINKFNVVETIQYPEDFSCTNVLPWSYGIKLKSYLKMNVVNGLSGNLQFENSTGIRANLTLSIVDSIRNSVDLIGYWRDKPTGNKSIEVVRSYENEKDKIFYKLNRHLIVTTKLEEPYVMLKPNLNNKNLTDKEKYEGYCIDLLEKISSICNFTYRIKLVDDGFHGSLVNGKWNGIVGELIDKKADLAAAALTITSLREQYIDFTEPFLNLGISILYKRPPKKQNQLFSFLSPLEIRVWLSVLLAYLVVSWVLFIIARFSPYEWVSNDETNADGKILENQFTVGNTLWFCLGGLMKQGTDLSPRSPSTKVVSCVWNFFTLILISSYTANLAAFITVQRMNTPLENVEALSKQTEIKYGPVKGGSTENFFKESKLVVYQKMWQFMSQNPDTFVKSSSEGVSRVKKGGFAYLLESTTNEYVRERDCELIQIGGLLDNKGYGLGTPTGSPWTNLISNAILKMQTFGDLQEFYEKWWRTNKKCEAMDVKDDSTSELSIGQIGGLFIIVGCGLILATLIVSFEFTWKAINTSQDMREFCKRYTKGLGSVFCHFFSNKFRNTFDKKPIKDMQIAEQKLRDANLRYSKRYRYKAKRKLKIIKENANLTTV